MTLQWNLIWQWAAAGLALFIPGISLLVWLPDRQAARRYPLVFLADGAALSLSILVLLSLWLSLAGIRVGAVGVCVFYGVGLGTLAAGLVFKTRFRLWPEKPYRAFWIACGGLAFFIGVAAWRLYQARALAFPAWVDSVHHVLVVRKIMEYGGVPPDLTPYIPAPFFYHYGFHLLTALFAFLTRQTPTQSVLWFGQVVNAAVAFSIYRAAWATWEEKTGQPEGSPWVWKSATAVAALSAGLAAFAFQMPAYYLTWGRYTLLAGLVLLGPALAAAQQALRDRMDYSAAVRLVLLTAGLCMTHYFALLLFALFLIGLGVTSLTRTIREPAQRLRLLYLAGWVGLGLLVSLPWLLRVGSVTHNSVEIHVTNLFSQSEETWNRAVNSLNYIGYLLGPRYNHILMGLAGIGLLFAWGRPSLRPLIVWTALLGLLCLPWAPQFGPFRPDLYAIVLFFPAAIFLSGLLVSSIEWLARIAQPGGMETPWLRLVLLVVLAAIVAGWGMRQTSNVINPDTIIADKADRAALEWVKVNIPSDARFYINSVPWQGIYRGVDGGYWLLPYTGRGNSVPPALYGYANREYFRQTQDWAERSARWTDCGEGFWQTMQEASLTHLYLRTGKGNVQPEAVRRCSGVHLLYQQSGISIYQINLEEGLARLGK